MTRRRVEAADFGLIRVDDDELHLVSPIMRGLGKAPTGFTTSEETATGDLLIGHGQGAPYTLAAPGRTQFGVLEDDNSLGFGTTLQGNSHRGSPVVRISDGKAVGIYAVPKSPSVLHVAGGVPGSEVLLGDPRSSILDRLAEEHFDVHLVTAATSCVRPYSQLRHAGGTVLHLRRGGEATHGVAARRRRPETGWCWRRRRRGGADARDAGGGGPELERLVDAEGCRAP